ncbi:MAG: rhodanese-like domain-containing protein [Pseudomonadota bacterium]
MTEWYDVTNNEAVKDLAEAQVLYIDIREPEEYLEEHVPGSVNIPVSRLAQTDWAPYQGAQVMLSCRSGKRTQINKAEILQKGLGEVYCLAGGIEQWKSAGLPTVKR